MSVALDYSLGSMPLEAASISIHYPQFHPVDVPDESSALCAWEGVIQPFASDASARAFLHLVEAQHPFGLSQGTLNCGDEDSPNAAHAHWADPFLVNMTQQCKLLVLDFPPPAHPRAYLLSPELSSACHSHHPHSRSDLPITVGKRRVFAACVYSAAEFSFSGEVDRIVEFLDQACVFAARHLIWLRTRKLYCRTPAGRKVVHAPRPGEMIIDTEMAFRNASIASIALKAFQFWDGYWPGKVAEVAGSGDHVRLLDPEGECWCGSGKTFGSCHRPIEALMS